MSSDNFAQGPPRPDVQIGMSNANDRPTVIPAAYPALVNEVYDCLDCINDRVTLMPSAGLLGWEPQAPPVPFGHDSWQDSEPTPDPRFLESLHPAKRAHYNEDGE